MSTACSPVTNNPQEEAMVAKWEAYAEMDASIARLGQNLRMQCFGSVAVEAQRLAEMAAKFKREQDEAMLKLNQRKGT